MRVLALDIARKTGWAVDGAATVPPAFVPTCGTYVLGWGSADPGRAGVQFWKFCDRVIREHQPERVIVEAPAVGGHGDFVMNRATSFLLLGLAFIAHSCASLHNVPVTEVAVQSWRKHFLGHGRPPDAKRAARALCERLGWSPQNDDEADACGVWHFGKSRFDRAFNVVAKPLLMP